MSDPTSTDEYPVDGSIAEVEAYVDAAGPDERDARVDEVLAREGEREHPRVGITDKNWTPETATDEQDGSDPTDIVGHGPGDTEPAAGDEDQTVTSADDGGAVPVATSTGPKLLALRNAASHDADEVSIPVPGVVATEDVYAEIVLAGTVTPTFQLVAKAGVIANPGDIAALPPR